MKDDSKIAAITIRGCEWTVRWDEDATEPGRPCWVEQVKFGRDWHDVLDVFSQPFVDEMNAALAALPDNRFPGVDIDAIHKTA